MKLSFNIALNMKKLATNWQGDNRKNSFKTKIDLGIDGNGPIIDYDNYDSGKSFNLIGFFNHKSKNL